MTWIAALLAVFVLGTLRAHRTSEAEGQAATAGWPLFHHELARSRRHGRPLCLARLPAAGNAEALLASLAPLIRAVDTAWVDHGGVYVLLPESDGEALRRLATRMRAADGVGNAVEQIRSVVFPHDGLTTGALVKRIAERDGSVADAPSAPADLLDPAGKTGMTGVRTAPAAAGQQ